MARYSRDPLRDFELGPTPLPSPGENLPGAFRTSGKRAGQDFPHGRARGCNQNWERGLEQELPRSQAGTVRDIGIFRSLSLDDLAEYRYQGDAVAAKRDLENLLRLGLIQRRTSYPERTVYVALTCRGHRLLRGRDGEREGEQRFYHGFVKTRDANHDAALYRLYQQEAHRIEGAGGRVERIVLDFELRRSINRRLAAMGSLPKVEREQEQQKIAEGHGLKVVRGKIPLPDLRLEYEGPDHGMAKVDLELVTHHYHHDALAAKAQAGFAMYASRQDTLRLRAAMADPGIIGDILSI
jgi:hypothetical protein